MSYPINIALSASLLFAGCTALSTVAEPDTKKSAEKVTEAVTENIKTTELEKVAKSAIKIPEKTDEAESTETKSIISSVKNSIEETSKITTEESTTVAMQNVETVQASTLIEDANTTMMQDELNTIGGKYTLDRGQIVFSGERKEILDSKLVIEQLNNEDLGYYYTVKIQDHPANEYFGILSKKDGKYVQEIISDDGEVSYYDNITFIQEDERVKLTISTNLEKRIIIWRKSDFLDDDEKLKGAKDIYNKMCKAHYEKLTAL